MNIFKMVFKKYYDRTPIVSDYSDQDYGSCSSPYEDGEFYFQRSFDSVINSLLKHKKFFQTKDNKHIFVTNLYKSTSKFINAIYIFDENLNHEKTYLIEKQRGSYLFSTRQAPYITKHDDGKYYAYSENMIHRNHMISNFDDGINLRNFLNQYIIECETDPDLLAKKVKNEAQKKTAEHLIYLDALCEVFITDITKLGRHQSIIIGDRFISTTIHGEGDYIHNKNFIIDIKEEKYEEFTDMYFLNAFINLDFRGAVVETGRYLKPQPYLDNPRDEYKHIIK